MEYSKTIAGITIEICEKAIGEDLVLTLSGGEKPHIGCVVHHRLELKQYLLLLL